MRSFSLNFNSSDAEFIITGETDAVFLADLYQRLNRIIELI